MNLLNDIYYQKDYVDLYKNEDSEIFEFYYTEGDSSFSNIAIKKPINNIGKTKLEGTYFDLETAYGYGGIYSNTEDQKFLNKAFDAYQKKCIESNIIADFSRIHPFNNTHLSLKDKFNLHVLDRKTIAVDTKLTNEIRWENYPSKLRNILRKGKKELTFRKSENINTFIELYNETMIKNNASEFYFFNKSYFEKLIALKNVDLYEVLYNNRVISATFVMFGEEIAHYHLSANDYEFRKHNANYFILDSLFDLAKEKGIKYFYLGGGRTNQEDDTLFRFKNKFSTIKKDFYIAGIIHNQIVYDKYCKIWDNEYQEDVKYFLKYRLNN